MKIIDIFVRGVLYASIREVFRSPVGAFILGVALGYILSYQNIITLNLPI